MYFPPGFQSQKDDINNPRSGGVMRQVGMKYQYSYEEQWQPKDFLVTFRMYQLNFKEDSSVFRKYWDNSAVRFVEIDYNYNSAENRERVRSGRKLMKV